MAEGILSYCTPLEPCEHLYDRIVGAPAAVLPAWRNAVEADEPQKSLTLRPHEYIVSRYVYIVHRYIDHQG